ncbi:hypothetical protein BGZ74_000328 [Mortierella antarctica]|nr:hypothetical protein BGZ74_000328 [Mortierella antarctica]
MDQLDSSLAVRNEVAHHMEHFENKKWRVKDLHVQRIRMAKAYQVITAHERRCAIEVARRTEDEQSPPMTSVSTLTGHCENCGKYHLQCMNGNREYVYDPVCPDNQKKALPVMLIGDSGTGVGSFIHGNERRGGKKLRHHHMHSSVVCITSEYRTSKTCSMCLWRIRLAKAIRTIKGKRHWVSVHGAVECLNKDCPSVQQGHCVKSRDGNATLNIGLAATSTLMHDSRKTLFQFSRHLTTLPVLTPATTTSVTSLLSSSLPLSSSSLSSVNPSALSTTTSTSTSLAPTPLVITGGGESQPPCLHWKSFPRCRQNTWTVARIDLNVLFH